MADLYPLGRETVFRDAGDHGVDPEYRFLSGRMDIVLPDRSESMECTGGAILASGAGLLSGSVVLSLHIFGGAVLFSGHGSVVGIGASSIRVGVYMSAPGSVDAGCGIVFGFAISVVLDPAPTVGVVGSDFMAEMVEKGTGNRSGKFGLA